MPREDVAELEAREDESAVETRLLDMPSGCLVDLEPSALPMWAMTRRYDRTRQGEQQFQWVGRSLTRDLVLEGGRTALRLRHADEEGEHFEFTEEYPGPDGKPFRVAFLLSNSTDGWLQSFEVRAGTSRVQGQRQREASTG